MTDYSTALSSNVRERSYIDGEWAACLEELSGAV